MLSKSYIAIYVQQIPLKKDSFGSYGRALTPSIAVVEVSFRNGGAGG